MGNRKTFTFTGETVDVQWDARLCIHMAECNRAEGELFDAAREPWCAPNETAPEKVAEVCERCPSGALSYVEKQGRGEQPATENTVTVSYNGPLFVKGALEIEGAPEDMPGVRFRAALCRCGQSKNKPFCDNSHLEAGFEDYGAVGEAGTGTEMVGGSLKVKVIKNGPLMLSGALAIYASSGRLAWQGPKTWLCRCGHSKNKPFCDGTHKEIGFTDG
ncbi:MAG: CDGSH iron-sulfur domain-containing protein [Magnetospiraceae bacterium]